jgi:hypothetical protein
MYTLSMRRLKPLAINLGLLIFAVILILGVLETVLGLTKFNVPEASRYLPGKGSTYMPNAYYRHTKEGFSEGLFNSHGFRDYERTYEKPHGVFRIVVLGDSYIEAFQVQLEESFTAQLEKLLNAHTAATRFEVLSLGESGFGTAEEYIRYLNFGVAYEPDLVILAFTTGNDFRNNSRLLNQDRMGFYYRFDDHRNLVLDRSLVDAYDNSQTYLRRLFQAVKSRSHLVTLISERVYLLNRQLQEARNIETYAVKTRSEDNVEKSFGLFSDLNIYREKPPQPWEEAVEITKEIILNFKGAVEEHGSRFLLVGLSSPEQVHPEMGRELKNQYKIEMDFEQPDRILEEFAREHGVLFLKLMPALRDHHLKTGQYLHGFGSSHGGHWNQTGHRIAAQLTFQFLKQQQLVPLERKAS